MQKLTSWVENDANQFNVNLLSWSLCYASGVTEVRFSFFILFTDWLVFL